MHMPMQMHPADFLQLPLQLIQQKDRGAKDTVFLPVFYSGQ